MDQILLGFSLGNAAILTNACLLPLYPGLIAFLAGSNQKQKGPTWGAALLGVLVLAGILTTMMIVGVLLVLLSAGAQQVLPILLPIVYAFVIVMGLFMLAGRNPFARLQTAQAPMLRNRYLTAYVYGLLFGPMTLPCTGPILVSSLSIATGTADVLDTFVYFFGFGLGFGWPLVVLPLIALPVQRRFVGWLARNHDALTRASGVLLVAVGIFGIITELLPQIMPTFEFPLAAQLAYWVLALLMTVGVGWWIVNRNQQADAAESSQATATS